MMHDYYFLAEVAVKTIENKQDAMVRFILLFKIVTDIIIGRADVDIFLQADA
jgi:hypothetical protein